MYQCHKTCKLYASYTLSYSLEDCYNSVSNLGDASRYQMASNLPKSSSIISVHPNLVCNIALLAHKKNEVRYLISSVRYIELAVLGFEFSGRAHKHEVVGLTFYQEQAFSSLFYQFLKNPQLPFSRNRYTANNLRE